MPARTPKTERRKPLSLMIKCPKQPEVQRHITEIRDERILSILIVQLSIGIEAVAEGLIWNRSGVEPR